jgi:hypothetical protein
LNGVCIRYWLLLLQKPGQWIEFDARQYGITIKTLFAYIEAESIRAGGRYKAYSIGLSRVGVRLLRTQGGKHE